jgi:hypothetical protein
MAFFLYLVIKKLHFNFFYHIFSIIRRLVTLISQQAQLQAQSEASQKQAQSASDAAKKLMEEKENLSNMVNSIFKKLRFYIAESLQ